MGFKVEMTAEFEAQLGDAVEYRIEHHGLKNARMLIDSVAHAQSLLERMPFMGAPLSQGDQAPADDTLRWIRAGAHIIAYRAFENAETITLMKIFHPSSDWKKRISHEQQR